MSAPIRIDLAKDEPDGRFSRFELIGWWDQRRLALAKVLLIGVGALGNEILKNLAMLGVGNVFAADLDLVENSNLSRSVLFRESDMGRPKAEAAAERARDIYPGIKIKPFQGNIVYDLGLGVYRWADVIIGGLDNREARVAINRAAARVGKPWIDGAIERLDGVARVFDPAVGPCYECTMGENDCYVRKHPRLQIVQAEGSPPERYQMHYQVLGLRQKDDELIEVDSHLVEISLPRDYPRMPPQCRMLTPVFHPNIAPHAICIGDHWSAGEPLASLLARIGEMITYQSYNTKSPLNGEAARWTDRNVDRLPLEAVSMVLDDSAVAGGAVERPPVRPVPPASPSAAAAPSAGPSLAAAPPASFACPQCGARLRHSPELAGKRIRCPKCQTIATVPEHP